MAHNDYWHNDYWHNDYFNDSTLDHEILKKTLFAPTSKVNIAQVTVDKRQLYHWADELADAIWTLGNEDGRTSSMRQWDEDLTEALGRLETLSREIDNVLRSMDATKSDSSDRDSR